MRARFMVYRAARNLRFVAEQRRMRRAGSSPTGERISFCTTVMDRFAHLRATLPENLEAAAEYEDAEFVVLNYSCPDPRTERWARDVLQPWIDEGRVSYYRYEDAVHHQPSHAKNLALRLGTGRILCSVDADNYIGKGFAEYVSTVLADGNTFLTGPRDGRGLGGRLCVRAEHFDAVTGHDERFKRYGPEDLDIANRLSLLGLHKRVILGERFCRTIAHPPQLSVKHQVLDDIDHAAVLRDNRDTIAPNRFYGRGTVIKNFEIEIEVGCEPTSSTDSAARAATLRASRFEAAGSDDTPSDRPPVNVVGPVRPARC